MTAQVLVTKLFIPPTRQERVSRPGLIQRLQEGYALGSKLSLISAPAGFGKTTLVTEWLDVLCLQQQDQHENRIAWLSLDEYDNDLVRFQVYLIAALRTVEPNLARGAVSALQSSQPPSIETTLTALINDIAAVNARLILVLDDYHMVDTQAIHDALTFLVENQPPQLHLIIATREDPHLPLSRLRSRGEVTELRAADLRFTTLETAEFLNQLMGLNLSEVDISMLETRTEGWIAGLQLAAISMQRHEDTNRFIQSFSGTHRLVLDYLIEEALDRQPEETQMFLLQTAVLNRMTSSLCDAITSREDCQETLELLEHANLFIIPLDDERRWYRYHHLFADLLRQRLQQITPERIPLLHTCASEWYEKNGFFEDAIEHALRARNFERAVGLIECVAAVYWENAQITNLRRWLEFLPDEFLVTSPNLSIFHAWFLRGRGKLDAAERTLRAAELAMESDRSRTANGETGPRSAAWQKFPGRAAAIRTFIHSYQGDVPGIIRFGREALDYLPKEDLNWRSMTAMALGDAHGYEGNMKAACKARMEALKAFRSVGDKHFFIVANLKVAITLREQGFLKRTIKICQQQKRLIDEIGLSRTRLAGFLSAIWGEALAELGDLEQGLDFTENGFKLLEHKGNLEMLGWGYLCLMRVLFSRGEFVDAEKLTQKLEEITQKTITPPWIPKYITAWQARLWLAQDMLEATSSWVNEQAFYIHGKPKPVQEIDYFLLFDYLVFARILIAQGRLEEATDLLLHLLIAAEEGERVTKVIEILILLALTAQEGSDKPQAINFLTRALTIAEPASYFQIFVDEGQPLAQLLYEALSKGISPDYVRRLLGALTDAGESEKRPRMTDQSELIEPLSEREIEVLEFIAKGLTNPEISTRLYVSPNTVKVHTRNIYGKLGVNNRTQAVARARTLRILPSD